MPAIAATHSPVLYIDCDVPAGMTLREWRAGRSIPSDQASMMSGVLRRVRRARRARQRQA